MIRPLTLLTVVAAAGAGLHVYNTKHAVSLLDRELRAIARDIGEAETRTQALQAEWAWATEQERLRGLAQRHLALEPMQPAQFVRLAEAERRLPPPAAHDGPMAHFAPPPAAGERTRIALLPPEAAPVPAGAVPLSAPVLAVVAQAAMAVAVEAPLPLPAPAAPELRPVSRNPIAFLPPPPVLRPVEPRPAAVEPARAAPQPRPPAAPRAVVVAAAPAAPALRPVVVAAAPTAAPASRPQPAATQVAVAAVSPRATEAAMSLGSFGSALGGGASALGSARAALPPPVAFGAALR